MIVLLQIVALVGIVFAFYRRNVTFVTYVYISFLIGFIFFNYFLIEPVQWAEIYLGKAFIFSALVIATAILFFLFDFIILNMIRHKQLILDVPFMLRGKIKFTPFIISMFIAIPEELLFRYYVLQKEGYSTIFLLLVGSLCFGLVHITFSKYDVFSKTILGVVCGVIFIVSENILFPILFHCIYNLFTLKSKQISTGGILYGNTDE